MPKLENNRAILVSAGFPGKRKATVHHHLLTRLVRIPGMGLCYEHIFKCFQTGAERRWGLDRGPNDLALVPMPDDGGN